MADKVLQSITVPELNSTFVNTPTSIAPTFNINQSYTIGDYVYYNRKLYKFTSAHSAGAWLGTDATEVTVGSELGGTIKDIKIYPGTSIVSGNIASIPVGTSSNYGILKVNRGVSASNGILDIYTALDSQIKQGTNQYNPITPSNQHFSVFYGLAKASGDITQSISNNAVGTYTDEAKGAIQHMLGIDNLAPYESDITADQAYAVGELFMLHGKLHRATAAINALDVFTVGTNCEVVNASDVFARDVQVNGTSILNQGVANLPIMGYNTIGVARAESTYGITTSGTTLVLNKASDNVVKQGTYNYQAIVPSSQHLSTFYGLAKAAGADMASSSNAVGTYTDDAKIAIRSMLGSLGSTDYASSSTGGVVKVTGNDGILIDANGVISSNVASSSQIKNGSNSRASITTNRQHESVFYGLAKASGDTTQSQSDNAVGIYTDNAKSSIKSMLSIMESGIEATDPNTDGNLRINTTANLSDDYVKKTDYASADNFGVTKTDTTWGVGTDSSTHKLYLVQATPSELKASSSLSRYKPVTPHNLNAAIFYGLAKVSGDTTQSESSNAVGTYTTEAKTAIRNMFGAVGDVQANGTSVVSNGVAEIPIANAPSKLGLVYAAGSGLTVQSDGKIVVQGSTDEEIKAGSNGNKPIVPSTQHKSTFYGLAKAAGDTSQSTSSNAVGTYTESAKSAIRLMLGMSSSIIGPYEETVSGSTPTITGQPNYRYLCGEVTNINITPPASGTIDVIFTSGSTVTVMTLPNTVKFPEWFDASTLEANTIYEIVITNGTYGGVMTWQV